MSNACVCRGRRNTRRCTSHTDLLRKPVHTLGFDASKKTGLVGGVHVETAMCSRCTASEHHVVELFARMVGVRTVVSHLCNQSSKRRSKRARKQRASKIFG